MSKKRYSVMVMMYDVDGVKWFTDQWK